MINVELDLGRVPGNFATGRDGGHFGPIFHCNRNFLTYTRGMTA